MSCDTHTNNLVVVSDNVNHNTVRVPQGDKNVVEVVAVGPQGPQGLSADDLFAATTGSLLVTASYLGDNQLQFEKGNGDLFIVDIDPFPYTGSAAVLGDINVTRNGTSTTDLFLVTVEDGNGDNEKVKVDSDGILTLGDLNTLPLTFSIVTGKH